VKVKTCCIEENKMIKVVSL